MNKELIKEIIIEMFKDGELNICVDVTDDLPSLSLRDPDEQTVTVEVYLTDEKGNYITGNKESLTFDKNR